MNVLQLISSSEGYYGAEHVCVSLSLGLKQIGVNAVVSAFRNSHKAVHVEVLDHARQLGLQTEEIESEGRFDWNSVRAIHSIIERHDIQIIHSHNIKGTLYAYLATRGRNVGLISTCHTWHINSVESWLLSILDRCLLHVDDRVVLVSDHMMPQIRRFGLKADVIYNGIDLTPFHHESTDFRQQMGWGERAVIAAVCRMNPEKGLSYLLEAAANTLRLYPQVLFVLAGDGPERENLKAQAEALGIQGSVRFTGFRTDVSELLSCVDILAISSVSEGLPMVLLEGMAAARAVVATRVGAIPNVILDRENGLLISAGDVAGLTAALLELLANKEHRTSLGLRARSTVQSRFSASSMASQYVQIYKELLTSTQSMRQRTDDSDTALSLGQSNSGCSSSQSGQSARRA